jgi:hypothetical protein
VQDRRREPRPNESDRRRHIRHRYGQIIEVTLQRIPGGGPMTGRTVLCKCADISSSGIKLVVDTYMPKNTAVVLQIHRRNVRQKFLRHGVVRWMEQPGTRSVYLVGIEFTDLTAHSRSGWQEFVDEVGASGSTNP